ncbi:GNAT family N-acetyltransferase [Nocardioides pocheonensis]|uniref:N-acetyltransferase n=1 Tax=Nocardioides pocheonensis TaxID=661485 RepID=A0A3N0GW40_9ACTN|nr:GNAT family N-acetyltransferase [Nocardioides pocheonensis]RNM16396.1 N-acetyltransferase [Nocardioides pocheonensis]
MDQHVRDATDADLPAVAEIYAYETAHSYSTFETEERPVHAWAHKLHGHYPFLVAEDDETVLGYAYASGFRDRPAYHRTVETSVYIHRDARGRRLGSLLYDALLARLVADGFHTALALIALPNDPSVRLHERAGFDLVGTMREVGDKQDRMIDVGVYQRML